MYVNINMYKFLFLSQSCYATDFSLAKLKFNKI